MIELDLATVRADGLALLSATESDWSRPIPHCPGWNAGDLVGHMGAVLAWMSNILATGERVARGDRETPPADRAVLADWYTGRLERILEVLHFTPSDTLVWTFSSRADRSAGWWRRRLAVELAIHRWDAQHAASLTGRPQPEAVDQRVATAGIEEFLTEFLPGMLSQPEIKDLNGILHLRPTDGLGGWWFDLNVGTASTTPTGGLIADTTVKGTQSDLLLWLTNREPSANLQILDHTDLAAAWAQLRR
jgi:uncharacterized protein (TIGR03083 family)